MSEQAAYDRFLSEKAVIDRTSLTHATIYRKMATGEFPRSVSISRARRGWIESEVVAWMASHIAARDAAQSVAA